MKKTVQALFFCILYLPAWSSEAGVEMADTLRSEGKIYIVAGVLAIIFTVLLAYLVLLDRKIASVERKMKNQN